MSMDAAKLTSDPVSATAAHAEPNSGVKETSTAAASLVMEEEFQRGKKLVEQDPAEAVPLLVEVGHHCMPADVAQLGSWMNTNT